LTIFSTQVWVCSLYVGVPLIQSSIEGQFWFIYKGFIAVQLVFSRRIACRVSYRILCCNAWNPSRWIKVGHGSFPWLSFVFPNNCNLLKNHTVHQVSITFVIVQRQTLSVCFQQDYEKLLLSDRHQSCISPQNKTCLPQNRNKRQLLEFMHLEM